MDTIIGHEHSQHILRAALRSGRTHHAWVFHGPRGVGKFSMALRVARSLLCHHRKEDGEACGACDACRRFASAAPDGEPSHPDLHVIRKEYAAISDFSHLRGRKQTNIPLDLLRERMIGGYVEERYIDPAVGIRPALGGGKVFIIDEAELLDREGQNALLKTLEEPPPSTWVFLITSSEDRLLPTVRSRCQRVPFGELDAENLARWVRGFLPTARAALEAQIDELSEATKLSAERGERLARLKEQRATLGDEDRVLRIVGAFAQGSPGRAGVMIEYGLIDWPEALWPGVERLAQGRADIQTGELMARLVNQFALDWVGAHANASKEAANRDAVRQMLGMIAELCRRRLRRVAEQADLADPAATEDAAAPWLAGLDVVRDAEWNLAANVNVGLLMENIAIQWARLARPLPVGR